MERKTISKVFIKYFKKRERRFLYKIIDLKYRLDLFLKHNSIENIDDIDELMYNFYSFYSSIEDFEEIYLSIKKYYKNKSDKKDIKKRNFIDRFYKHVFYEYLKVFITYIYLLRLFTNYKDINELKYLHKVINAIMNLCLNIATRVFMKFDNHNKIFCYMDLLKRTLFTRYLGDGICEFFYYRYNHDVNLKDILLHLYAHYFLLKYRILFTIDKIRFRKKLDINKSLVLKSKFLLHDYVYYSNNIKTRILMANFVNLYIATLVKFYKMSLDYKIFNRLITYDKKGNINTNDIDSQNQQEI